MCHMISVQLTAECHSNKNISVITRWQWRVRKLCSYTRWKHELVGANVLFTTLFYNILIQQISIASIPDWNIPLSQCTATADQIMRPDTTLSTRGYLSRLMMTLFNGGYPRPQWINRNANSLFYIFIFGISTTRPRCCHARLSCLSVSPELVIIVTTRNINRYGRLSVFFNKTQVFPATKI